jgi:HK97 family phage portal protein
VSPQRNNHLPERRAVTKFGPIGRIPSNGETGFVHAGESVTEHTALNVISFFACVRLLADTVASLPWDAYRKRDGERRQVDPEPSLLRDPYPTGTAFEWKHQMMVSLGVRGNFYGLVTARDVWEHPTAIQPLHPDDVLRHRDERGRLVSRVGGEVVPNEDVFHVRGFTLPGSEEGLSPINLARHSIGLGLAAQRFGARWFADGAAPSSVLSTKEPMDEAQARRNQQEWIESHGGRRLPAFLSGGLEYKPITITPEESQFLGTREFTTKEMAMLVGVPPHMIGDVERSTSWGTGIEQQSIGFVTYNLRAWLVRIEEAVTGLLPRGQFVKFNVNALLRGDTKSRYEAYTQARNAGWMNADEIRQLEDRPPLPDGKGQEYLQPLNMGPLGSDPLAERNEDD